MALSTKCVFLRKPMETLILSQSHRQLFVDYTLKCPVMHEMLLNRTNPKDEKANVCPMKFSTDPTGIRTAGIHTASQVNAPNKPGKLDDSVNKKEPAFTTQTGPFKYDEFFNEMIEKKKQDHSYRVFRKMNRKANNFPMAADYTYQREPENVTVWCSNDYLGMSRHPTVVNAAKLVIDQNGVGAGGTRSIAGTSLYHDLLEKSLAEWHQKEAGLIFSSCYVANDTALYTLGQKLPGCIIFSDEGNHASMIHGIRTSGAPKKIFRHNDPEHLEELLRNSDPNVPKIVAFETVHSMTGAVCPLEELCDISHRYGALTFVDEVHAVGLYGKHGAGIGERDGVLDKMDIISGTLGKAIGCIGGYLVGKEKLIDTLRSYGSGFIFTTAMPPDKAYAAMQSLEIIKAKEGHELRERHKNNVKRLRTKLVQHGFPVEHAPSHIVPVLTGNAQKCTHVSQYLQRNHGIYIQAINYPTVPRGSEKLRIAPTPFHNEVMMDELVEALDAGWKDAGLSYLRPVCDVSCTCQDVCMEHEEKNVAFKM